MDVQIPLYRAKKLESDEYVVSFLILPNPDMKDGIVTFEESPVEMDTGHVDVYTVTHSIDPSTLAIHFAGMNDKNGVKIFASLSEDGKGGDKLKIVALTNDHCQKGTISELTAFVQMGRVCVGAGVPIYPLNLTHSFQTIGIQQ